MIFDDDDRDIEDLDLDFNRGRDRNYDYDYDSDFDRGAHNAPIIYMTLGVSVFVLILLGVIIAMNGKSNRSSSYAEYKASLESQTEEVTEEEVPEVAHKITADDLDFWDMYSNKRTETDTAGRNTDSSADPDASGTEDPEHKGKPLPTPTMPISDDEKYDDGKHFKIEFADGSSEWIAIDTSRELNNYNFMNLKSNDGKMHYYLEGRAVSFLGIDVSRYQKDIDFIQVKNAGIDFVMIRVGARGYQSGTIALDEYFTKNIAAATEAGLDVGVYFYSQAITAAEALEEANMVIEACKDYKIKYPVAYDMEFVENDKSRVETLSKDERTLIAGTFINKIVEAGYKPMLYGNEEWLVKRVDTKNMIGVGIWLADESDMPDYPYQYDMWQYSTKGSIFGIEGPVDMDLCFIDYSAR
ncbi:MAG: glycoside hydrolase family 25 protein [Lachnospiraceae bacterium]|nr:glycoside hydrolase family 25 protein [Lachnospiraceae bacterium]